MGLNAFVMGLNRSLRNYDLHDLYDLDRHLPEVYVRRVPR